MTDSGNTFEKILLKACIDSPNDMLVLAIDKHYNYLAFNTYHEKVMKLAYGIEIKQGMNLIKCITNEDDIIKSKANYSRAFEGESHITIEEYGEIDRQYYETRYNPIRNENNEIVGATAFSFNVTERKKIETTLKDNERFLLESQSVARLGTFVWDLTDGLWKSSKILDEIFGIDEKFKRTLHGWEKLIHPKWKKTMHHYVTYDVLGKHQKFDKEYLIIRQTDDQQRWVHGLAELELDANGNPKRLIGTISDITSRKLSEERLREQSEELEQRVAERTAQLELANKELESFAYSVSHDLRAPLRAIDGFSKFLIDDPNYSLDQESVRLLNLIRSNTKKMDQLISDILSLSRVSRNSLKKSRLDMGKMAISMLNEVASPDLQKKFSIIAGEMPEAFADSTYLKQVWINLISNAIKFSSKTNEPQIELGGYSEGNFNVYYVRDNGVGFKPEYGHKLFGVFQRLHKADEFEGNGVGLAIVQRIIHRHEGKVWAEGKPGEGAVFYFSLPVIK
jgi:signal transduction histidine kinase